MPTPAWKMEYFTSNARCVATNKVDQLEMREVTFERHQRLPSRWHYAINNSTLRNPKLLPLKCLMHVMRQQIEWTHWKCKKTIDRSSVLCSSNLWKVGCIERIFSVYWFPFIQVNRILNQISLSIPNFLITKHLFIYIVSLKEWWCCGWVAK